MLPNRSLDFLPGLIAVLLWSTGAYFIYQMKNIPACQIMVCGQIIGGILSLHLEKHTLSIKRLINRVKKGWLFLCAFWISQYGYIYAFQNAPPAQIDLIFYTWPVMLIIAESCIHSEKLSLRDWVGMILGFLGITILLYPDLRENAISPLYFLGYMGGALGALGWVYYLISTEKYASSKTGFSSIGEDILILGIISLFFLASTKQWVEPEVNEWMMLMFYAVGMFGVPYYLWRITLLKNPKMAGALSNASPILSIFWLVLAGITAFTIELVAAFSLVTIGILCINRLPENKRIVSRSD